MAEEIKRLCLIKEKDCTVSEIKYLVKLATKGYQHENIDHVLAALGFIDELIKPSAKASPFHKQFLKTELFCISCNESSTSNNAVKIVSETVINHVKNTLDAAHQNKLRQSSPIIMDLLEIYKGNTSDECPCVLGKLRTLKYAEILCAIVQKIIFKSKKEISEKSTEIES